MSVNALQVLKEHWAVSAIGDDDLSRADLLVNEMLARRTVGEQVESLPDADESDEALLGRVLLAYEMAAIEGLDELSRSTSDDRMLRDQAMAACDRVFDILRLQPVPSDTHERLFFILQFSAIACCGDRWSDLCRWCNDNEKVLEVPSVDGASWDERLLYRLFDCWVRLFRKDSRSDLHQIGEIVASLRSDQGKFEEDCLRNGSPAENQAIALRLAALYHWAKGTEIVAEYMVQGQPPNSPALIDKHFDAGIKAVTASGDAQHEVMLRWLHAAAQTMAAL